MEVIFHDPSHTYFVEGRKIPSVSELVDYALGYGYDGVPDYILEKAAQHGTRVHDAIERYLQKKENDGLPLVAEWSLEEYKELEKLYGIKPIAIEELVHFDGRYAGRYDLLAYVNRKRTLIDHKTVAELDKERLRWQLGYYKLARENMYPEEKIDAVAGIWLPKEKKGVYVKIRQVAKAKLLENLERYESEKEQALQSLPF